MYKFRKKGCLVMLLLLVICTMATACGDNVKEQTATASTVAAASSSTVKETTGEETTKLEPVELTYYFGGGQQKDLQVVNDEVNKILKEKINATIKLNLIDWGGYEQKMNVLISSGENFDLCYTATWINNYYQNVAKGAYVAIDELLEKYAPKTKAGVPEKIWLAAKVNGKTWGVINYQIMATGYGISVQKSLADKYNFDWKSVTKFQDLEPYLEAVKKGEPGKIPLGYANTADTFVGAAPAYNMDTIGDQKSPGWVYLNDESKKVVNQYDTPEFKELIKRTRVYYQKGYYRKDASTTKEITTDNKAAKYAASFPSYLAFDSIDNPSDKGVLNAATGVEWYDKKITKPIITTDRAAATITSISKTSKNPERAMMFIELVNSDKPLYNILSWGIEAKHYTKVSDNKISLIVDSGYDPRTSWVFGSNLNLYLAADQTEDYITNWDNLNKTSEMSSLLGFTFDSEPVKSEIAQCQSVVEEYLYGLTTGSIDPDKYQPEFIDKLKKAGSEKIIAEKQKQIDAWVASNQ